MIKIEPKELADNLFGPEDELKEVCIHCRNIWYAIHYKDGVCHDCQKKGLPGKKTLARRAKKREVIILAIISVGILGYFLARFF